MKKIILFNQFIAFFSVINLLVSCWDDKTVTQPLCPAVANTKIKSINEFDGNLASSFYAQAVLNYKLTQTIKSYQGTACQSSPTEYEIGLQIQNNTNKKISFDYSITFTLNFIQWNYQGAATINPYGTIDIGIINNNGADVSLGQVLVISNRITYQ